VSAPDEPTPPRVTVEGLRSLGSDDWARVLPLVRRVLNELEDEAASPEVRRIRALPTGRLAAGPRRAELCALVLAEEGRRRRLEGLLDEAGLLERLGGRPAEGSVGARSSRPPAGADAAAATDRSREQRRLQRAREERDRARRRAEGAEARVERAERRAEAAEQDAARLDRELARAREALDAAQAEQRRVVDRERRRGEARAEELREELRGLRREAQEAAAQAQRRREAQRPAPAPGEGREPDAGTGAVPGRPTRLPETVVWDSAEGVDLLLGPARLVLVDGYNVTLKHRPSLDLPGQRDWLVRRLATLAAQRRVRPVVVFDGERGSGQRPAVGAREVEVRFTPAGVTADDELVFAVEALPPDEPVVVVTDDRELTARLRVLAADVVGTGPFLWATPG
jgi:hypothetical protein